MSDFCVVETQILALQAALNEGRVTSVELVAFYLDRIAFYDRHGILLNSVIVFNPDMFADASASDQRRRMGQPLGPLDGVPYTVKDSYKVRGLTVAAGSPAFAKLVANTDAFTVERLRAAGAILLGRTNMPPMANGGMQRGFYGRSESPYNERFLTAPFGSGSSNGAGTATAASFAAFGLAEETWSSGRGPASCNGLCAYTPSRGVISLRGNWPLVPTMDVVVPYTRTMADLLMVLDVIVSDDRNPRGDFWRMQPWVRIPKASTVRPPSFTSLQDDSALHGKRIGVPKLYINSDPGPSVSPIDHILTRPTVVDRWKLARAALEAAGAEVIEVDLPVVTNYETRGRPPPADCSLGARGLVPEAFAERELWELSMFGWQDFLDANGDPALHDLKDVEPEKISPPPKGALEDRYGDHLHRFAPETEVVLSEYVLRARSGGVPTLESIPDLPAGLRGLEDARRLDFETWMAAQRLDAIVYPTVADVGPADADTNAASAALAWRNGTWVANGNLVWRHLGIPAVTVPMGQMSDIGMPIGLTIAGHSYNDSALLAYAWAFEQAQVRANRPPRTAPPRTPELLGRTLWAAAGQGLTVASHCSKRARTVSPPINLSASIIDPGVDRPDITIAVVVKTTAKEVSITVNGVEVPVCLEADGSRFTAMTSVSSSEHKRAHSEWRGGYGSIIVALARSAAGGVAGAYRVVGGVE